MKSIKDIIKEEISDYRGHHEAPGPNDVDSPMYDLTNTYGEDIYGPQALRLFGHQPYDQYSIRLMQLARNKPNMQVKIYRAVPKVISNQEKIDDYQKRLKYILKTGKLPRDVDNFRNTSEYYDYLSDEIEQLKKNPDDQKVKINNGDWVTINPQYAKTHGQSNVGQFRVLSKTVSAKNLYNEGDVNEWGYNESTDNNSLNEEQNFNDNFWQWFGNSKVVYSNGEPAVVYHGPRWTKRAFNIFKGKETIGWFAEDESKARGYNSEKMYEVYLSIQKPFYLHGDMNDDITIEKFEERIGFKLNRVNLPKSYEKDINNENKIEDEKQLYVWQLVLQTITSFQEQLLGMGYDGIYAYEDKYATWGVIKSPSQIKSVKNNGEFNSASNNILKEIIEDSKTSFNDVPDDIFGQLINTKYSIDANKSHMKVFKAKNGKDYLIRKTINDDIFRVFDLNKNNNFQQPIGVAIFDVHSDYFSGYEHRQSIEVKPNYRRMGIATALTDFAEKIYNLPYKPTNLQTPEMQGFTKNRLGEVKGSNKKLYYHGRNPGNRPYSGKYVFITNDLGYASGYSDGKILYVFTIPFSEGKIFSIKNPSHEELLRKYTDDQTVDALIRDSGPQQEIDWATLSYISTDEHEDPMELFEYLGFYGVRLKERQGIDSIYIFDESKLKSEGTIDISTPEMKDKIGKFYRDFAKGKNFLEETSEGVADKYAERQFNIPDSSAQQDYQATKALKANNTMGEYIGDVLEYGGDDDNYRKKSNVEARVFANPKSLQDFDNNARAVSDDKGNFFVCDRNGSFFHEHIEKVVMQSKYGNAHTDYIQWYRQGNSNMFTLSSTYSQTINKPLDKEEEAKYIQALRQKNPQYRFLVPKDNLNESISKPSIGVNINDDVAPFTEYILNGEKTIETRNTPTLRPYVGKRIGIIKTGKKIKATLVGYVNIDKEIVYDSKEKFDKDYSKHLVGGDSPYFFDNIKFGYSLKDPERISPTPITSKGIVSRKL